VYIKTIIRLIGYKFMSWQNEFLLLYVYYYRKISFKTCEVFRTASHTKCYRTVLLPNR